MTVKVIGAATMLSTTPKSVYINSKGPFRNSTLLVSTPGGIKAKTVDLGTGLRGAELGSLILLHELGHLTGVFTRDAEDPKLNLSYTQKIKEACFRKA